MRRWRRGSRPAAGDPPPAASRPRSRAELDAETEPGSRARSGRASRRPSPAAPVGVWSGPLPSAFGWHLVRVAERQPGRPAQLRGGARRGGRGRSASTAARRPSRRSSRARLGRYRVTVDGQPLRALHPLAPRAFRSVRLGGRLMRRAVSIVAPAACAARSSPRARGRTARDRSRWRSPRSRKGKAVVHVRASLPEDARRARVVLAAPCTPAQAQEARRRHRRDRRRGVPGVARRAAGSRVEGLGPDPLGGHPGGLVAR